MKTGTIVATLCASWHFLMQLRLVFVLGCHQTSCFFQVAAHQQHCNRLPWCLLLPFAFWPLSSLQAVHCTLLNFSRPPSSIFVFGYVSFPLALLDSVSCMLPYVSCIQVYACMAQSSRAWGKLFHFTVPLCPLIRSRADKRRYFVDYSKDPGSLSLDSDLTRLPWASMGQRDWAVNNMEHGTNRTAGMLSLGCLSVRHSNGSVQTSREQD